MFRVYLTNHYQFLNSDYDTFEDAVAAAKAKGYQSVIYWKNPDKTSTWGLVPYAEFCPVGGLKNLSDVAQRIVNRALQSDGR